MRKKFETNILINPSPNYDVDLYDYKNFATIGGISSNSVLVKSATDLIGINPITFDDEKSSTKLVENINLFDRLNIYNFLTKIDHTILNKYNSDFEDYTKDIYDEPGPQIMFGDNPPICDQLAPEDPHDAELQDKIDQFDDEQLDRTFKLPRENLGVIKDEDGKVMLDVDSLAFWKQRVFLLFVEDEHMQKWA